MKPRPGVPGPLVAGLVLLTVALSEAVATGPWAWLGVRIRDLSEFEMDEISRHHGLREGYGVVIVAVVEESPAEQAGLRGGDIVVALGARPIVDTRTFQRLIASTPVGTSVTLTLLRRDGREPVSVQLGEMPPGVVGERVAADLGFFLREGVVEGERGGGPDGVERAAVVADLQQGGLADQAGLESGDVLLRVNEEPVTSYRAAVLALARSPSEGPLRLTVARGPVERVSVTIQRPPR